MPASRSTIRPLVFSRTFRHAILTSGLFLSCGFVAVAQQPSPPPPQAPAQQAPATTPPPNFQSSSEWDKLPRMHIERQFAGPLRDTVIQRLRDPVDGTICYVYLPISVAHSQTQNTGFVQYNGNVIGTLNCMLSSKPAAVRKPAAPDPAK